MAGNTLARSGGHEAGRALEIPATGYALTTPQEVDSDATMLKARWGSSASLQAEDFRAMAIIARECGMNPIFDLDVMGGRPYDNANFWRGLLASHPNVVSLEQHRVRPGTDEWEEWVGVDEDDVVAAAVLTRVEMTNRAVPIVEVNYVLKTDSILYEGEKPQELGTGEEGERRARALEAKGTKIWLGKADGNKPRMWMARMMSLLPDWRARALKKARSTSLRRAAKVAVPMEHARVLRGMDRMERLIEAREQAGPRAAVVTQADPYTALPAAGAADGGDRVLTRQLPPPTPISEEHRRMLWAQASQKGLDEVDLKALIGRVLQVPREQVSTKTITYEQLPRIVEAIQEIPDAGFDEIDEEEAVASAPRGGGPPDFADVPPPEDPRLDLGGGW